MDRRTKILSAAFAAVLSTLILSFVYREWLEPLLAIDAEIAGLQKEYDTLRATEDDVDRGKKEYMAFVSRIGSFDVGKVATEIRARINELIEKHHLQDAKTSPSRPEQKRKTNLTTMQITVTAVGKLKSVVGFLADLAELPQLVRLGNAAVYPASSSRRGQSRNRMNLKVPIEVMVLPQQRIVGLIDEAELARPDSFPPRHVGRDYSMIWTRKPFTEPIPLRAEAGRDVNRRQRQSSRLMGTATGGEAPYACSWEPSDSLQDPDNCKTDVDTSEAFTRTYTLTVTDDEGETATDSVVVTIQESRVALRPGRPEPKPPREIDPRWPDRKYMQLRMTLLRSDGSKSIDELLIYNNKSRAASYYTVGDPFNGGELVFVHPTGGLVRRKDVYYIHPIGSWLNDEIGVDGEDAADFPELKAAAERQRKSDKAASKPPQDTAGTSTGAEPEKAVSVAPAPTKDRRNGAAGRTGVRGAKGRGKASKLRTDPMTLRFGKRRGAEVEAPKASEAESVEKKPGSRPARAGKKGTRRVRRSRNRP